MNKTQADSLNSAVARMTAAVAAIDTEAVSRRLSAVFREMQAAMDRPNAK